MESKDVQIKPVAEQPQGCNFSFILSCNGFSGLFRIHFEDESRKNSSYKKRRARTVYWEGKNPNHDYATTVCYRAIEALLFVEEKKQWILEYHLKDE